MWVKKMKCSRCQNEDVQYFFENNGRIYCRKCIAFSTKTVNLKPVKNEKKIYYHLNYSLNLEQERTSLSRYGKASYSSKINKSNIRGYRYS